MKNQFTAFSPPRVSQTEVFQDTKVVEIMLLLTFLFSITFTFNAEAHAVNANSSGPEYRYLRLTILEGVSNKAIAISEINWLVGAEVYPQPRITSPSFAVTAPGTNNEATAYRAYDGKTGTRSSVWIPKSNAFPYSSVIDFGEGIAIHPTAIQIEMVRKTRAIAAFSCEGSEDGINWTTLYSTSGLTSSDWTNFSFITFEFPDTEAPTAPSGLFASDIGTESLTLNWNVSSDNVGVEVYEVFEGSESKGTTIDTSLELSGLQCGSSYNLTVVARDAAGNTSDTSEVIMVETMHCDFSEENLISNGEFDEGKTGWVSIFHSPAAGSFEVVSDADMSGNNAGKIAIDAGGAGWQIELFTVFNLENGKTYDLSFQAKGDADRTAQVTFQKGADPYNNYWQETVTLTNATQDFGPFRWTSNVGDPATRLNFRFGGSDADVWIDNIVVTEVVLTGDTEPPTAPGNLAASEISENGVQLSWDASTDNVGVARYEVFANYISRGNTTETSIELEGLDCDAEYDIVVKAIDLDGNVSEASEALNVETEICTGTSEPKNAQLGMNMASPRAWNSEFAFTNLAHYSLDWMPVETAPNFGVRIPLEELTPERNLQPGATGRLVVFWDLSEAYISSGEYVFTYDGTAEVSLSSYSSNGISEVSNSPGRIVVNMTSTSSKIFLYFDVTSNSTTDPIHNISFRELDRENSTEIFRPEFIEEYGSLQAFRFMDWGQVNNSTVSVWEEYSADSALLQTKGVSYSYQIALANETGMDAWFCLPLLADDDYIRQFAAKVKNELDPDIKIYLELSNEVWNGTFAATGQAAQKARELGISDLGNDKQDAGYYYGYRTAQIENIFTEELAMEDEVRDFTQVASWQAVDSWSFENMVLPGYRLIMGEGSAPSAIAIAPYFGGGLAGSNTSIVESWTVEHVVEQLKYGTYSDILPGKSSTELAHSVTNMKNYKTVAERHNISSLMAYESGQHMVGSNSTLVNLFQEVNRDRGMYDLYLAYMNEWRNLGGDLFAIFASTSAYGNSGSWGWKEYPAQTREEAPKYDAILEWNSSYGMSASGAGSKASLGLSEKLTSENGNTLIIYPNPAGNGSVTVRFTNALQNNLVIMNLSGKVYMDAFVNQEAKTVSLKDFKPGTYIFKVNGVARRVIVQ